MPHFDYKASNASGATVNGRIEAADRKQAARILAAQGLRPIVIQSADGKSSMPEKADAVVIHDDSAMKKGGLMGRVSNKTTGLSFLQKLLDLVNSGLPMGDAVRLLSQRVTDPELKGLANRIWKQLSEGRTLSSIMHKMPEYFDSSDANLVESGEATGNLGPIIEKIVAHKEEVAELKAKILGGLAYPTFVLCIAGGVVVFLVTFLLPKLKNMMDKLGGKVHWTTELLLTGSDLALKYGPFIIGALAIATLALSRWRTTTEGKQATDLWLLRIPLLGRIFLYAEIFQITTLLSTLLNSGITTTEALKLAERNVRNSLLRAKFSMARHMVQEGVSLATAFSRTRFLNDISNDILTVGENTGNMVVPLKQIAQAHRKDLTRLLHLLTQIVSTVAMTIAFTLVALIAVSIVLAVFNVSSSIRAR